MVSDYRNKTAANAVKIFKRTRALVRFIKDNFFYKSDPLPTSGLGGNEI